MTLAIATSTKDAQAAESIVGHHSAMLDEARALAEAAVHDPKARTALIHWCKHELFPHATAEEQVLYAAARPMAPLLIEALIMEHQALQSLLAELSAQSEGVRIAAAARALLAVLEGHVEKENDLVVPLLASASDISLADLLATMHTELSTAPAAESAEHGASGDCTCGETDGDDYPVLDARAVPHAIRHATVFGALDAVRPGKGLILVAPHDPLPLLKQLEQRSPDTFDVSYRQRGPEAWRLLVMRKQTA